MKPSRIEKRADGYWYIVDENGLMLAEIKGPPKHMHDEIAKVVSQFFGLEIYDKTEDFK